MTPNDAATIKTYFRDRPFKRGTISITDYAETTFLPSGKYRGVRFSHKRAPYLFEPLSLLSPESSIQEVRCQFPAQTGKSTVAEMMIEYYIVEYPSEILYVSSNETAAIKFMQRRIEPRCAIKGVEFRSEVLSKSARRTGDTSYSKLFNGGNLDVASSLSPAQLASETKSRVVADEIDRWKLSISAEGNPLDILYARTQAWGDEKKILIISTPTTEDVSLINKLYLEGDQRLFWVPCPFCGTMQLLDFIEGKGHGLKWEHKDGKINRRSIVYVCESCGKEIKENRKNEMLNGGEWRKSAVSIADHIASFHINGLYSPFLTWYEMAIGYEESQNDQVKKQSFDNLKMGRVFKPIGSKIRADRLIENRSTYRSGTVPDGVLFLTGFVDVQEGSKSDPANPPRLEMEILGVGKLWRTWSICYEVFTGDVDNAYGSAWEEMLQWFVQKHEGGTFYRNDGAPFPLRILLVDSGSGRMSDTVYDFCARPEYQNFFPSKGMSEIKIGKKDRDVRPDEIIQGNRITWRRSVTDDGVLIFLINTNYYKTRIANFFNVARVDGPVQKFGYSSFPADYSDHYFDMFTAEERRRDGSWHNPAGRRNEAFDCRVGCMCGADIWLSDEVQRHRDAAKAAKLPPEETFKYDKNYILNVIEQQTVRRAIG